MNEISNGLAGRSALVTGAGRGIGRAIALGLADAGADAIALTSRSEDELEQTAGLVRERGTSAVVLPADLGDRAHVASMARRAADELGTVEILVNNAAVVWPLGPSAGVDAGEWAAALDVNVVSVVALTVALLPAMLEHGWGRIANISSGIVAQPTAMIGGNAYVTTKAALEAHTVNLAAELDGSGVTVNAFRPGTVDTAMQAWIRDQEPERIGAGLHERFRRYQEDGALITPEQSARVLVERLAGDATGQVWDVVDA